MKFIKENFDKSVERERKITEYLQKRVNEDVITNSDGEVVPNPPETQEALGIANMINLLIQDEWQAIEGYNNTISSLQTMCGDEYPDKDDSINYTAMIGVLADIVAEENNHVGMLQKLMQTVAPNADEIDSGSEEAAETIVDNQTQAEEQPVKD